MHSLKVAILRNSLNLGSLKRVPRSWSVYSSWVISHQSSQRDVIFEMLREMFSRMSVILDSSLRMFSRLIKLGEAFGEVSSNTSVGRLGRATSNAEARPKDYESSWIDFYSSFSKGSSQSLFKVAIDSNILLLKLLISSIWEISVPGFSTFCLIFTNLSKSSSGLPPFFGEMKI